MQVGFLNSDTDNEQSLFDYKIDLTIDLCPFFKSESDIYELQAVVTVEEGVLGVMSFATYIQNTKKEWLKINM